MLMRIMYIMLNVPGHLKDMLLLAHKFDPFPAVTLREFC